MKDNEINEKLARLDGWEFIDNRGPYTPEHDGKHRRDYCNDLNLLMPLAWKYHIKTESTAFNEVDASYVSYCGKANGFGEDPKQAIIQCLLKIAEENE